MFDQVLTQTVMGHWKLETDYKRFPGRDFWQDGICHKLVSDKAINLAYGFLYCKGTLSQDYVTRQFYRHTMSLFYATSSLLFALVMHTILKQSIHCVESGIQRDLSLMMLILFKKTNHQM